MQIDLKTVNVKALRNTFANVADRIGGDKQASRYQEATMGMQPDVNFHYRPTWDPDHEIFDPARTARLGGVEVAVEDLLGQRPDAVDT